MVVDGLVAGEVPAHVLVDGGLIGHEPAVWVGVASEDRPHSVGSHIRDMEAADSAATLHQGHDGCLGGMGP